jgi:hypothetical protein
MVVIKEVKGLKVELIVVRAYMTSQEVRANHGIFANFSAKLAINGQTVVSLQALTVRTSRDGVPFIGSQGEKVKDGWLSYVSFFSGPENDEKEDERRAFVKAVVQEVNAFYANAQSRLKERETKGFAHSSELDSMPCAAPKAATKSGQPSQGDDAPF